MNGSPTLLVMAAGLASRYGSLKQLAPFGPNGETIIDYSVYDAIRAGFGKVVFIIQKSIEAEFKSVLLHKFSKYIAVDFVLQELPILPTGYSVPPGRIKPWGTGHAIWVASSKITEPFAVINGDDFYGRQSLQLLADFLKNNPNQEGALIGFELANTLSEHGAVSRGICTVDANGYLEKVTERTHIVRTAAGIVAQDPEHHEIKLSGQEFVSMNLMGFTPSILPYFENYFKDFLDVKLAADAKAEFFLPEVINQLVQAGKIKVKVLPSPEKWFGVTYPADKQVAEKSIHRLIQNGTYPEKLWH